MTNGWLVSLTACWACLVAVPLADAAPKTDATHIYVSTFGKDSWSGRLADPNPEKTDGPFATLDRARDEIRKLKESNAAPAGATVLIRGGSYYLKKAFELGAGDSGAETAPIVYRAFPGEDVRISGGKLIGTFTPVTDPTTLGQLDESARGKVVQADLKAQGIADPGAADQDGAEVFFDDKPMTLSRWPNTGFVRIADLAEHDAHEINGVKGSKIGKFKYDGDRPNRWLHERDPWLHGYWFWDWSDQRQKIESIDTKTSTIALTPPYHSYGYRKGQWYYAFNMLCELDSPGEWYIDREKNILYFWPPQTINSAKTVVSNLANVIVTKDTSYVTFQGLILEGSRASAVTVTGGKMVQLEQCVMRNTGGGGADLTGVGHSVTNCEIYQVGAGGITLTGGDRPTLAPGALRADNNHIHHYGRVKPMYTPGVSLNGVGNYATHNLIHDAPHMAIFFSGNEHVMEFNEIHHVCLESNDAGAIYAGRNWTMRGNMIRHNYLHEITGFENRGCVGVYLDDMFASATIYGNVFYKVVSAAFIGGGRDCTVENNIFVDCKPALHVDARALNWAAYHADDWIKEANEKGTILGIAYNKPPYSERYPKLITILNDNPKAPVGNLIARNICWGGKWDDIEEIARPLLAFENNLLNEDPHFVDADKQNFQLKKDSPAFKLGFKEIPIEKIGMKPVSVSGKVAQENTKRVLDAAGIAAKTQVSAWLALARRSRDHGDYATARLYSKCALGVKAASEDDRARVYLEQGHIEACAHDVSGALRCFGKAAGTKGAASHIRSLAQLQLAAAYQRENKLSAARAAYGKVAALPDAPPQHIAEARDGLSALERQTKEATDIGQTASAKRPEPGLRLHIATTGSDTNTGTAEKPLATIQRAVDAVATLKAGAGLPAGGVEIVVAGGVYKLKQGISITKAASGVENAPLTISAKKGQLVRISGGAPVRDFKPVTDKAILARLPEEARGKVLVADLPAQGISHFAPLVYRGFSAGSKPSLELFFNGKPMTPARWPNEGFVRTGKVPDAGDMRQNRGGVFAFDNERLQRWGQAHDIWLYGYWYYDWADNTIGLASLDAANHQIHTTQASNYGIKEGQPFYVFNLLEEIDKPGEWYLDRQTGRLYFYPPDRLDNATVEVSLLEEPLIRMEDVSHVTIQGLTLEQGAGDGIVIKNGEDCLVAGCDLKQLGSSGVSIVGGHRSGVLSCAIHTLGRGGTTIIGGDRAALTPGNHFVENCSIHDFSRIDRTYTPAVQIEGVGNRIAHNHFYDSPAHAIRLEGNDHLVEYNDIHDVVRETDDQGGIDLFLNPSYRGNTLRYNYWHDIGNDRACGQAGIRLDDAISGTVIYGNVFYRCSEANFGGVQIHGGKDNWVDNNIFIECKYGVSFSPWGKDRWEKFLAGDSIVALLTKEVDISTPPYSTRYPALARLHEGNDINMIWRNIVYNCGEFMNHDQGIQSLIDNFVTRQDPGFVDAAKHNFMLKDDAAVLSATGFRNIPFDKIGQYDDAYWTALKGSAK